MSWRYPWSPRSSRPRGQFSGSAAALVDDGASWTQRSDPSGHFGRWALAFVLAATLIGAACLVGRELSRIKDLATTMQHTVLPQVILQQRRAIWIESLRSAAQVVVYAPGRETRQDALSKAEQLAANVTDLETAKGAALGQAWALIRRAAERADEAERIDAEIRATLREADSLISDMSNNLGSIVEDSAGTLARLIKEVLSERDQGGLTRETLEEVLSINTTSQDLLASLDQGRVLLASARTMADASEIERAARQFRTIGRQLKLRVDTLRGNSDYEYLPARIERFVDLAVMFDLRREWLRVRDQAITAGTQATLELGRLRETLNADAADVAEQTTAAITANVGRIERSANGTLLALALIGLFVAARYRRALSVLTSTDAIKSEDQGAQRTDEVAAAQLRATLSSLEAFLTEHGNLEHLRQSLPGRFKQTASGVLEHLGRAEAGALAHAVIGSGSAGDLGAPGSCPPCRPRLPATDDASLLPEGWSAPKVVERVNEIAAASSTAALLAVYGSVCAMHRTKTEEAPSDNGLRVGGPRHSDLALSLRALEQAADVAGSATEQVNLVLGEINALARRADEAGEPYDAGRALAEIDRQIEGLSAALSATGAALGSPSSGTG